VLFLYDFSVLNPVVCQAVKVFVSSQVTKNKMAAENRLTYLLHTNYTKNKQ